MTTKTSNPARGVAAGLGNVKAVAAIDIPRDNPSPRSLQLKFLQRRLGLPRAQLEVIAALAFGGRS